MLTALTICAGTVFLPVIGNNMRDLK